MGVLCFFLGLNLMLNGWPLTGLFMWWMAISD